MNTETRLALEILSESKYKSHQKRYEVIVRFSEIYGVLPTLERMVRNLPKSEDLINNVTVSNDLTEKISYYEEKLEQDPNDKQALNALDILYDSDFRNSKN